MSRQITAPHVYRAITAITEALSRTGIAKSRTNLKDDYQYRSIDDVLERLAPLLSKHRLCVLPRVIRREAVERFSEAQTVLMSVHLIVAFDLVSSRDGSRHTVRASGEAVDPSDKATAKASSAAFKSAMLQTFCIPIGGADEPDACSHRFRSSAHAAEPVQGWPTWVEDIIGMIGICETGDALERVRTRNATLLTSVSRERSELYAKIGEAFAVRTNELAVRVRSHHEGKADAVPRTPQVKTDEAISG